MTSQEMEDRLAKVVGEINDAGGKVVEKKGWFWSLLHYVVIVVTFGSNRNFLRGFYTTIGGVVGYPQGWEKRPIESRIAVLEHELIHIRQCARLGFGHVWLGFPLYMVLYLLVPFPIGLAYMRYRYEREAYAHGINVRVAMQPDLYDRLIDSAVKNLTTGAYGWTWPFPKSVRRYFEENCPDILRNKMMMQGMVDRNVQ